MTTFWELIIIYNGIGGPIVELDEKFRSPHLCDVRATNTIAWMMAGYPIEVFGWTITFRQTRATYACMPQKAVIRARCRHSPRGSHQINSGGTER